MGANTGRNPVERRPGEELTAGNVETSIGNHSSACLCTWSTSKWSVETTDWQQYGRNCDSILAWWIRRSCSIRKTWGARNAQQKVMIKGSTPTAQFFRRITTTQVNETKTPQPVRQSQKATSWSYEMARHAETRVKHILSWPRESIAQLKQAESRCIDDHQINPEYFKLAGEPATVCAHVVLKCLVSARNGRPFSGQ